MAVVKTYADDGKSGLNLRGRPALVQLLSDIEHGVAQFRAVLVYDVSRWGRFQDVDESAYYEYLCRRAGINVIYCAESFGEDGPIAAMVKAIKRAMAGEFSRELSKKVFAGQCRLVERGYRQGGVPGYAIRRLLIDDQGVPKGVLANGERKHLQTDRVVLVPGPPDEVAVVQRIYQRYVDDGVPERQIVRELNDDGLFTAQGKPWCRASVKQVLTNEKYAGANVFNRASFKLRMIRSQNPIEMWVRNDNAYAPIVTTERFRAAQRRRTAAKVRVSKEQLLDDLSRLLKKHGRLTTRIIDRENGRANRRMLISRFGSLLNAFRAVGFDGALNAGLLDQMRRSMAKTHFYMREFTQRMEERGVRVRRAGSSCQFELSTRIVIRLVVARQNTLRSNWRAWREKLAGSEPDFFVVYRMTQGEVVDGYFLFPAAAIPAHPDELYKALCNEFQMRDLESLIIAAAGKMPSAG